MKYFLKLSAKRLFAAVVILPMLLYSLYLGLVAADRYVSEAVVSVRSLGADGGSALPGAALLLAGINPPSHEDTLYLYEFVHSLGLLKTLDQRLGLRRHYSESRPDLPFVLEDDASQEDFLRYYRSRVEVSIDQRTGLLRVRAQGFDAAFAQKLSRAVLEECERFVNETSQRFAGERLRFAEGELKLASQRLQDARNQVLAFQNKHRLLDPNAQAEATGALTTELQGTRSRLEAELNGLLSYLNEDSFQVQALRSRLAAIDRQVETERSRATTTPQRGERINSLAVEFQGLQLQADFARDAYRLALGAVENARIESTRKIKSLVVVEPPTLPQTAEYPLVAYNLGTLLAVSLLLFAILRLAIATIREHQD
jgi:capsular polysaccharide transport system permease protein